MATLLFYQRLAELEKEGVQFEDNEHTSVDDEFHIERLQTINDSLNET